MPRVPVYESQAPTAALPTPQVSLDTTGIGQGMAQGLASAGRSATEAGDAMSAVYKHAKEQADATATTKAETAWQAEANDAIYNPDTGLHAKRGDAGFAASADVADKIEKRRQEIAATLTNDHQKQLFLLRTGGMANGYNEHIETYAGAQRIAAQQASVQGLQSVNLQALSQNYADPVQRAKLIAQPEGSIKALSLSKEDAAADLAAWRVKAHETVLNQYMASNDWTGAETYLSQTKGELGPASATYEHRINVLKNQTTADSMAQKLVQENQDENGRPIEGAIWSKVDALPPGEQRKAIEEQVQLHMQRQLRAFDQVEGDRLGRVVTGIEQSGGQLNMASDDYQRLTPANKAKALERRNTMLRSDKGEQNQMDREELKRFSALEPEERATVDINTQFPSASQTARYQMTAQQHSIKSLIGRGGLEKAKEFDGQIRTVAGEVLRNKDLSDEFTRQMKDWYHDQLSENNGKPPTREEVEKELTARLLKSKGWGWTHWGAADYRFRVPQDEPFDPAPDAEQPYLQFKQKAAGAAPTQAAAPAPAPAAPSAQAAPAGAVKGKDGNYYRKNANGKWARVNG